MSQFITAFSEHPLSLVLFIVIGIALTFFLIRSLIKTVAIVGGALLLLYFGFGFSPLDLFEKGKTIIGFAEPIYESTVVPLLKEELKDATAESLPDGTYVIKTKNLLLTGKKGADVVTVRYQDNEVTLRSSELKKLIEQHAFHLKEFQLEELAAV